MHSSLPRYQPAGFDFTVRPEDGSVAFGSGLQGWAFTLPTFAKMIAKGTGKEEKIATRLWGEHYHDRATGKWRRLASTDDGQPLVRGFCQYVLGPIYELFRARKVDDVATLEILGKKAGVTLKKEHLELPPEKLLRRILSRWLPASTEMLYQIDRHLPSPREAQQYVFSFLSFVFCWSPAGAVCACESGLLFVMLVVPCPGIACPICTVETRRTPLERPCGAVTLPARSWSTSVRWWCRRQRKEERSWHLVAFSPAPLPRAIRFMYSTQSTARAAAQSPPSRPECRRLSSWVGVFFCLLPSFSTPGAPLPGWLGLPRLSWIYFACCADLLTCLTRADVD